MKSILALTILTLSFNVFTREVTEDTRDYAVKANKHIFYTCECKANKKHGVSLVISNNYNNAVDTIRFVNVDKEGNTVSSSAQKACDEALKFEDRCINAY